jgi:exosortase/archaeosortase
MRAQPGFRTSEIATNIRKNEVHENFTSVHSHFNNDNYNQFISVGSGFPTAVVTAVTPIESRALAGGTTLLSGTGALKRTSAAALVALSCNSGRIG